MRVLLVLTWLLVIAWKWRGRESLFLAPSTSAFPFHRSGRVREDSAKVSSAGQGMFSHVINLNACLCKKCYFEVGSFCSLLANFSVLIKLQPIACVLSGWRKWVYIPVRVAFDRKTINIKIFMRNVCWECRAGFAFPRKCLGVEF